MSSEIHINKDSSKEEKYNELLPQISSLVKDEPSIIANLANITAALKEVFNWLWVGFYLVDNSKNELVLGPFQGPVACTRIAFGKGVCGTSWKEKRNLLVPDVEKFPGHIACSSLSVSEIVIPVFNYKNDILDEIDVKYLEKLALIISGMFVSIKRND